MYGASKDELDSLVQVVRICYLRKSTEWILQAALKEEAIVEEESRHDYERRRKDEKVKNRNERALHGVFVQQISDEAREQSWSSIGMDLKKKR